MGDIYSTPSATLTDAPATIDQGSLERAIAGDYQFSIGATLSEAWAKTKGAKWKIHLALLVYMLGYAVIMFGAMAVVGLLFGSAAIIGGEAVTPAAALAGSLVPQIAIALLGTPLMAGLYMVGIRRAVDAPFGPGQVIAYFHRLLPLFGTYLLMVVLLILGFLLLILPGIYLSIAYMLAIPLVVEKNMSPWQALEASRKAVGKRWFAVFGLFIVIMLINLVAMIPLTIGLIWSVPLSLIAYGILYRNVFGVEAANRV